MKKTNFLRRFWYSLSSNQRYIIRRLYFLPIDLYDKFTGKRHKYVPPRGMIYTGSSVSSKAYIEQGLYQLELLKNELSLQPNDRVLDIGSGVGRTAIALTTFLNNEGSYEGFDVVKKGIDWCKSGIGKDFKNFNFKYVPLFNDLYNTSKLKAIDFKFPYEKKSFDKIFSFSLFTHMQIEEVQHYFNEISKVLKHNGMCFSTFFLYDTEDETYISTKGAFRFPFKKEGYRLMNEKVKSGNIAFHKTKIKDMLKNSNLECVKIVDGYWKDEINNQGKKISQDIIIFKKCIK